MLPYAGLVQAPDGHLYGTTMRGGTNDNGTIFRLTLDGRFAIVLHQFSGEDGENPEGTLIVGSDGNLYGTTLQGGDGDRGTIFRITTGRHLHVAVFLPDAGRVQHLRPGDQRDRRESRAAALLLAADGNYLRHGLSGRSRRLRHGVPHDTRRCG